ncbi:DUF4233 domain-containing protein [Leucobacter sp. CX87]|uniref:DUF4233 domain-containing protein n=1 Tax=unclassified Leucobacter TaxID=2621730 RepID=UPI00333FCF16
MSDPVTQPDGGEELVLSPSEAMGAGAAMHLAGGRGARRSTQRALGSIVLGFELFVVFLAGMTVFGLGVIEPRELGIWGGLGLCAVILVALGTMRLGKVGLTLGWVVHGLMFLAGFVLPPSLIIVVIFTALWVYCMVVGARLDRQSAAAHQAA